MANEDLYSPDPPSNITYTYICPECGARYESTAKLSSMNGCRNIGCNGKPKRR